MQASATHITFHLIARLPRISHMQHHKHIAPSSLLLDEHAKCVRTYIWKFCSASNKHMRIYSNVRYRDCLLLTSFPARTFYRGVFCWWGGAICVFRQAKPQCHWTEAERKNKTVWNECRSIRHVMEMTTSAFQFLRIQDFLENSLVEFSEILCVCLNILTVEYCNNILIIKRMSFVTPNILFM